MLDKTQKIVETRYEENMTTTALVRIIGWKTKRPGVKAQYSRTFPVITVISPHMRKPYTVEDYALTFRKGSVYF